jgi:hypothetical protein
MKEKIGKKAQKTFDGLLYLGPVGCPACGSTQVRPTEVHCMPAGKAGGMASVDACGVHLAKHLGPGGLDAMILLEFCCDSDHAFQVAYAYRRNETVLTIAVMPDKPGAKALCSK